MPSEETLIALNHVLAGLYPVREESYRIVKQAGIPLEFVDFRNKAIDNWFEILRAAENRNRVLDIVHAALKEHPQNSVLMQAAKGDVKPVIAPVIDKELPWKGNFSTDTLERIMGSQSTFLPVSFLETGVQRARSVAKIDLNNGVSGSGFLLRDNLFVTNHHVIPDRETASAAEILFNYEKSAAGLDHQPESFRLDPESGFATSAEQDWSLIRVSGNANEKWGAIEIKEVDVSKAQRVNIIQHPGGGPKQIAIYHNVVAYTGENRIQYLTDTLPGSSGAPVFNSQWEVVAVHRSGGWILEPGTKNQVFRNEGVNINRVVQGMRAAGL